MGVAAGVEVLVAGRVGPRAGRLEVPAVGPGDPAVETRLERALAVDVVDVDGHHVQWVGRVDGEAGDVASPGGRRVVALPVVIAEPQLADRGLRPGGRAAGLV